MPTFGECMVRSLVAIFLLSCCCSAKEASSGGVGLEPHYEVRQGVEVIWQIPPNCRRILFIAHGVGYFPNNFWDPSPSCPHCTGLPEERAIAVAALNRGYAVISVTSLGEQWMDWPLETNLDFRNVLLILSTWRDEFGLVGLPLTGLGISDGGTFMSILAVAVDAFASTVIMISSANNDAIDFAAEEGDYPPTLFIQMPNDEASSNNIAENLRKLAASGIIASEMKCNSFPVYESYFTERIPAMDLNTSTRIFEALGAHKYLDSRGNIVKPNPDAADWDLYTDWNWTEVVANLDVLPHNHDGTLQWGPSVEEEISLAYAFHCPTSLRVSEMLDWLDGNSRPQSGILVAAV